MEVLISAIYFVIYFVIFRFVLILMAYVTLQNPLLILIVKLTIVAS